MWEKQSRQSISAFGYTNDARTTSFSFALSLSLEKRERIDDCYKRYFSFLQNELIIVFFSFSPPHRVRSVRTDAERRGRKAIRCVVINTWWRDREWNRIITGISADPIDRPFFFVFFAFWFSCDRLVYLFHSRITIDHGARFWFRFYCWHDWNRRRLSVWYRESSSADSNNQLSIVFRFLRLFC